jgi:hypothetical protein
MHAHQSGGGSGGGGGGWCTCVCCGAELDPATISLYGGMQEVWLNITLDATDVQTNGGPPTVLLELQVTGVQSRAMLSWTM